MPRLPQPDAHEAPSREQSEQPESPRLLRALAHPLRDQIIEVLTVEGPLTARDLATAVARSPTTVRRHLRILEEAGAVERIRDAGSSRASSATFSATARSIFTNEEWAQLPIGDRRALFRGTVARITGHVASALATGGFDRPDTHVSWVPTAVDEDAYAQIRDLLLEVESRLVAIQAGADARRRRERPRDVHPLQSEVVVLHFLRAERVESAPPRGPSPRDWQRMYALVDVLAEELPNDTVDWRRAASAVHELAAIVDQQRAAAPAVTASPL